MTCVVVDDDEMVLTSLKRLCEKSEMFSEVLFFNDGEDAAQHFFNSVPDVVFLDIEMPRLSGLELLKSFDKIQNVIVISGKKEYAFDAYQLNVIDYLSKPVTLPRFLKALEKVKTKTNHAEVKDLYVKVDGKLTRVPFADVDYIESLTDYIRIHTSKNKYIVYSSLTHIEGKLPTNDFMKVHRSFIVNMNKIKDIDENMIVINESLIPVSRANQPELLKRLNLLK